MPGASSPKTTTPRISPDCRTHHPYYRPENILGSGRGKTPRLPRRVRTAQTLENKAASQLFETAFKKLKNRCNALLTHTDVILTYTSLSLDPVEC